MAPRSPDDQQDDLASRAGQDQTAQDADAAGRSPRSERPAAASGEPEGLDFGAFVSRSVRSSADRLKDSASSRAARREESREAKPTQRPTPIHRERPARYWRDSFRERSGEDVTVSSPGARRFLNRGETPPAEGPPGDDGGNGGDGGGAWWQSLTSGGDDGGPNRQLIGLIALGAIILLALIFLFTRLVGDDDPGEDVTPTATSPAVLDQPTDDAGGTPTANDQPATTVQEEPTETPAVRRGGDNQRDQSDEGTPQSDVQGEGELAVAPTPLPLGPVARECPDACLVRLEGVGDAAKLFAETGSRPSFQGDGVSWLISTPQQITVFEQQVDIEIVRKSSETLYLYMVTIPKDKDDAIIGDVGSVLDASGRFRLIEVDQVPARVRGLTDSGYAVSKFAPPQPTVVDMHQEQPPLANIEIGALMGDVSYDNVSETISTMQTIGAGDGASLGTRYYTLAGNQIAAEYLFQRLESYGLNVWYEDFLTPEGILLVNVVGEVPGKDQSAVYGVMAHFDTTSEAPGTAPGADDNATGIAASLEIARILAGYQLKHPVRIIFVNAEEVGILGSNVWARTANANDVPMEGVFNVDSVGSDRQGSLMILNSDAESAWMQDLLIEMNNAYGLGQEVMSRQNPGIVADDNMVREQGIEAVMIARELYGWSPYHHSSSDVMDFVSIDNVVSMTYVVLLSVASLVQ
jgi:hypothetical protein